MLYTPNYNVRTSVYCGPTAMAAVTGESISAIHQAICSIRGHVPANGNVRPVSGMYNQELVAAMVQLGWHVVEAGDWSMAFRRHGRCLRLGEFLDQRGHDGPFIISASRHYFAVSHGEICDTGMRLPQDIDRFNRKKVGRKCWVKAWWRFEYLSYDDYYDDDDAALADCWENQTCDGGI